MRLTKRYLHIARVFFYSLVFLIPTQAGKHFWPGFSFVQGIRIDYLSPTIYLTDLLWIGCMFFWVMSFRKKTLAPFFSKHEKFITIGIVLGSIHTIFSISPAITLIALLRLFQALSLFIFIQKEQPSLKTTALLLLGSGLYSSCIAWFQWNLQSSIGSLLWFLGERTFSLSTPDIARVTFQNSQYLRPYATFSHPNVLAGYLVCILPFLTFLDSSGKTGRMLKTPLLLFILGTIGITFSRSAWIAMTLSALILMASTKRADFFSNKNRVRMLLIGILVLLSLPLVMVRINALWTTNLQSVYERIDSWQSARALITTNALFGVGAGSYIRALPDVDLIRSYRDLQPVHMVFLLFFAEWGIVGLGAGAYMVGKLIKQQVNNWTSHPVFFSVVSLLIISLLDHYPYTMHQFHLLLPVLAGSVTYPINVWHNKGRYENSF